MKVLVSGKRDTPIKGDRCFSELWIDVLELDLLSKHDKESSRSISHSPKVKTKFIVPLFSQTLCQ